MIRTAALSLMFAGALALGACRADDNASDRRERASNDNGPVWFNGNGERVAHADLMNGPCDDWCSAGRSPYSNDVYSSSSSEEERADGTWTKPSCGCTKDRAMKEQRQQREQDYPNQ